MEHPHREASLKSLVLHTNYNLAISSPHSLLLVLYQFYLFTGVWPQLTYAKHSVASFKLRKGMPTGVLQSLSSKPILKNFLSIFLTNFVNLRSLRSSEESPASFILNQHGQAQLGIKNIQLLKGFYLDKEEGIHKLMTSFPTFGVNISVHLPTSGAHLRLRNAMILSQLLFPVKLA